MIVMVVLERGFKSCDEIESYSEGCQKTIKKAVEVKVITARTTKSLTSIGQVEKER
jgi:hypothetical protein